jgi:hypothetical protein
MPYSMAPLACPTTGQDDDVLVALDLAHRTPTIGYKNRPSPSAHAFPTHHLFHLPTTPLHTPPTRSALLLLASRRAPPWSP